MDKIRKLLLQCRGRASNLTFNPSAQPLATELCKFLEELDAEFQRVIPEIKTEMKKELTK